MKFESLMTCLHFQPSWQDTSLPVHKSWSGIGNIDQFRWLVRSDVREHLAMARDEIGLRHVRACAMFSNELRVRTPSLPDWKSPAGQRAVVMNWQTVDYCLDGLLDLGLKPVITTCFTPEWMTSNPASCWPDKNRTTPPADLQAWQELVAGCLKHLIQRYGVDEVTSWYFECWNEPNLTGFFNGTQEDFFRLWSSTWHALKAVLPEIRFGGPSTARGEWIPEFLKWTASDETRPDFLISHVYNNDSESEPLSPFDGPASDRVKDSPHFASGVIRGVRKFLDSVDWKGEVHWNEWGRSWFPYDPRRETALEAAFIAKTMSETSSTADAFAFWCLSDVYDQIGYTASEFDSHYGMLSLHGLRKPAWWAHVLLNRLEGRSVSVNGGDALTGALASRTHDSGSILLHSYPAEVSAPTEPVQVAIELPPHATKVRLTRLGLEENNIAALWKSMGSPTHPVREELRTLRDANQLLQADDVAVRDHQAHFAMERPGVALLEFAIS